MLPIKATVTKTRSETEQVTAISFDVSLEEAKPGQFVMAWLQGVDEKPISISGNAGGLELAISRAGPVSTKLAQLRTGDKLFIRGPLGRGFDFVGSRWLLVGGGYGFGPLRFLAKTGMEAGKQVEAVLGARTKTLLMEKAACETHITTDDGSAGEKGTSVDTAAKLLGSKACDCVYSCGPEKMMAALARLCAEKKIPCQLLVERYMKCGVGLCGHCAMGKWLACADGPMIYGEEALKVPEFGVSHRDKAGCKTSW